MVLTRALLLLLLPAMLGLSVPAAAHKEHKDRQAEQKAPAPAAALPPAMHGPASVPAAAAPPSSFAGRTMDWVGRVHPFAVHFPIALFPIAWLALIFARRRGHPTDVIRALIIVAGAGAAISGLLGWINAGTLADRDWLHVGHRWLGTGLGLLGAAIAIWAWRRAAAVESRAMMGALALTTLLLLVQGWFGGALVHGVDHMNW